MSLARLIILFGQGETGNPFSAWAMAGSKRRFKASTMIPVRHGQHPDDARRPAAPPVLARKDRRLPSAVKIRLAGWSPAVPVRRGLDFPIRFPKCMRNAPPPIPELCGSTE